MSRMILGTAGGVLLLGLVILAYVGLVSLLSQRLPDADAASASPFAPDGLMSFAPIESHALHPLDAGSLQPIETERIHWTYPNAQSLDSISLIKETATYADGTVSHTELGARDVFYTSDDFQAVVDHYTAQMKDLLPVDASEVGEHTVANGVVLMIDDAGPGHDREPRALNLASLSLLAANCSINLTINRGPDEDATYIQVIYNEWPVAVHE